MTALAQPPIVRYNVANGGDQLDRLGEYVGCVRRGRCAATIKYGGWND
jgi:hypothetical protein